MRTPTKPRIRVFLAALLGLTAAIRAQPCTTVIAYGDAPRAGTLAAPGQQDCVLFQGAVGDELMVSIAGTFDRFFTVRDPSGATLCSRSGNGRLVCTLAVAGMHSLTVQSATNVQTGNYWFAIQRLNGPVGCERLCYGNSVRGEISGQVEHDCYLFPGTTNSMIQLTLTGTFDRFAEIRDANGKVVCTRNGNGSVDCTLPATGTYSLAVLSAGLLQSGSYTVAIRCLTLPCECTADHWNYGSGWSGTNGVPTLTTTGEPVMGTGIDFQVSNSLGADTDALLLFGFSNVDLDSGFGGRLLVGAPISLVLFRLPVAGASIPFGVPSNTALCNVCAHLQVVQVDAGASHGLSFTDGLTIVLGN